MIHPDSRTLSWIEQVANDNKIEDITLVEKTIRASHCWKHWLDRVAHFCSREVRP